MDPMQLRLDLTTVALLIKALDAGDGSSLTSSERHRARSLATYLRYRADRYWHLGGQHLEDASAGSSQQQQPHGHAPGWRQA